ncbi:hypothetical protein RFI_04015, partial [Reticulomyxa filosa]
MQQAQKQERERGDSRTMKANQSDDIKDTSVISSIKTERGKFVAAAAESTSKDNNNNNNNNNTNANNARALEDDIAYPVGIVQMLLSALEKFDKLSVFT